MIRRRLIEYCKKKKIFLPPNPSKEYLVKAIKRAAEHNSIQKSEKCYGKWEHENMTCTLCDFEKKCFRTSIGIEKEEFFKALEKAENPKLRFTHRLKKKNR